MSQPEIILDLIEMRERWRKLPEYGCFWSSPDNPKGLGLTPKIEPNRLSCEMTIDRERSGFPGIAHGGVGYTILDGLMGWYIMSHTGRAGLTTESRVQYKRPLLVGKTYLFVVDAKHVRSTEAGGLRLVGQVFDKKDTKEERPLMHIEADFILPNFDLATAIMGVDLGDEGAKLFPKP